MKRLIISVFYVFAIGISFAQVASDYYMPFCVGNQTVLVDYGDIDNWGHTATFTYLQSDFINTDLCFLQEGKLYSHSGCCETEVFHLIWLFKDLNGDVYLKAYSEEYPDLDSAIILSTPILYFSNNYFTTGYSVSQTVEPGHIVIDSVISTDAVYGGFTNCIQIRETDIVNDTITNIGDSYYAFGVGRVGEQRIFPTDEIGTSTLVSAYVTSCDPIVDTIPANEEDACLGDYFDYYVNSIIVDTVNSLLTVTWNFQDSVITNQFVETYGFQIEGNNVISITLNCSGKSSETYYKPININPSFHLDISENVNADLVSIFPNPASDNVVLSINGDVADGSSYRIFNSTGFLVSAGDITKNQHHINVSDFANGLYFVEIFSANHIEPQKLIIQK
ncbi:MAG: hypothetical protein A2W93_08705 [Bacteroidetes bacterium GWF2_43_63]|nr:MAG: hypothetical protein A2W94_03090 [Bacteroidetes bacterium GWE2_42_42]OFY55211.1 MAG: hypothetical protein A2W93_08705 [Bacteroidetes bacterium GWF2_43_63]HBG70912.1 hypothetical protein [Bacteroidales bacterium]HCB63324.1 hypothetical protein [Bacteroidales bacterium]HCY23027.1 hypothetical protein [Bacteroidales bacterium]